MFSKKERQYLSKNLQSAKSYERVLKHRIKEKLKKENKITCQIQQKMLEKEQK